MPMLSVIQYEVGQKVGWAMMTLMVLAAIALVVVVLMQKSSGEDMSAIAGYNQKNDSFFGICSRISDKMRSQCTLPPGVA